MDGVLHDLGPATSLAAEALGAPGQRRFRLVVDSPRGSVYLWLEKEQLLNLGLAVRQLLATIEEHDTPREMPEQLSSGAESGAQRLSLEFKVRKLVLGHDGSGKRFVLLAHDVEDEEGKEEAAKVSCWVSRDQLSDLSDEALEVCAAGRPTCPLCGAPKGPETHICARSNGHAILS